MTDIGSSKSGLKKPLDFLSLETVAVLMESLPEGCMLVDASGVICYINQAFRHLYSGGPEISDSVPLAEVLPREWVEVKKVLALGVSSLFSIMELPMATVIVSRIPVYLQDRIYGVLCIVQDIDNFHSIVTEFTEFKNLQKEFEAVLERFDCPFISVDVHGIICNVNSAYEKFISLGRLGLIGRFLGKVQRSPQKLIQLYKQALSSEARISMPIPLSDDSSVMGTATPAYDTEGNIFRILLQMSGQSSRPPSAALQSLPLEEALLSESLQEICRRSGFMIYSGVMSRVVSQALKVSKTDSCILITGESGTGKSMMATLIHNNSDRASKPFVPINCGAIPESLIESELFGYEKGAFTGANTSGKTGLFEVANNGTLFLDEIGELQYSIQSKLLEAIEKKSFLRVGGTKRISVNIRIIAATNRNLTEEVDKGTFRRDLFYRLNVIPIRIPPLRERPEDVRHMIDRIITEHNAKNETGKRLSPELLDWLLHYPFPGNMRELINVMEWLLVMGEREVLGLMDLPSTLREKYGIVSSGFSGQAEEKKIPPPKADDGSSLPIPQMPPTEQPLVEDTPLSYVEQMLENKLSLKAAVETFERAYLEKAMERYTSIQAVSERIDIHFSTLWRKLVKYGLIEKSNVQEKHHER